MTEHILSNIEEATIIVRLGLNTITETGEIKDEMPVTKIGPINMNWVDPVRGYAAECRWPTPEGFFLWQAITLSCESTHDTQINK